jgi:hypothetical protein
MGNEPSLSERLRATSAKLGQRHPGVAQTNEDVALLFRELQALGFKRRQEHFATSDSAGRFAFDGPAIAAYFRECADSLDDR